MLEKIHNIQNNIKLKRLGEWAFYLAFLIETLILIVDKSAIHNAFEGRLFQITFLLCFIKVLSTKYEWREYITIFIFCFLGLLIDQLGDRNEILRIFMFIAACKNVDMKRVLRWYFWIVAAGSALIIALSMLGVLGSVLELKEYKDEGFIERYAFGMGNPNAFHIMIFCLVLMGLYVYKEKLRWWCYPPLLLLDYGLYQLSDARTPAIMLAGAVILLFFEKYLDILNVKWGNPWKFILKLASFLAYLVCIACVELNIYFASEAWKVYAFNWGQMHWEPDIARIVRFDRALTGRICSLMNYENRAGSFATWRLFAQPNHTEFFDLGFVRMFYWYGIIPTIIILLIFAALIGYLISEGKYTEIVVLLLIAVFTVFEAHFVSVYIGRCYPVFILGMYWDKIVECFKFKEKKAGNESDKKLDEVL